MNGEVNGIMEEAVESSLPASSISKPAQQKVTPDDCDEVTNHCENSNNTESSNHVDSESNTCSTDNGIVENRSTEEDKELIPELVSDPLTIVTGQGNCSDTVQNNCEDSNNSHSESAQTCLENSVSVNQLLNDKSQNNDHSTKKCENERPDEPTQNSNDEADSVDSSGDDESVVSSREKHRAEDTVSINSDSEEEGDDETSQESQAQYKSNDIIILDNENQSGSHNGNSDSHEVHEIDSDNDDDDCVVATEGKEEEKPVENDKAPLRRSSRAIKRKRYTDDIENGDESDIEEIDYHDHINRRGKPIVINDTRALVEMAAKQTKHSNSQKKEPTVVIIDTHSMVSTKGTSLIQGKNSITNSALSAQNLYQSIVARGTTVTPVSSKNSMSTQVSPNTQPTQPAQPAILPSLTDDMFVVEAPSFIVPYVYEKPSIKPFREFVYKLGKELEEQKIKDQPENKENQDEGNDKEGNGEPSKDENKSTQNTEESEETATKKKKSNRKDRRQRDDDDASWDGESASESDDALSDEEDKIVVKDKTEPIDQIKNVTELTADKIVSSQTIAHSSMDCSLGKFFINIGLNLVQEFVQTDLLKQQNRKLYREKKSGQNTKATESSIVQLMKNLEFSKENNAPYAQPQKRCQFCSFKSESMLVMAHHLETPHMKNNVYKCNYCPFEIRSPHDILYHMEAEHNVRGKLERAPAYHQCANCPFEDNGKGKLARHLIACAKKFKPDMNLAPPVEWEPPAKIPKISKPRNSVMGPYQNTFNRGQTGNNVTRTPVMGSVVVPGLAMGYRPRSRLPMGAPPRAPPVHGIPIIRPGQMTRQNSPVLMQSNFPVANNVKPKSVHQPSISITPLPRQPQPQIQPTQNPQQSKSSFVICEICDGYIKDLEQLRNHMQWIHKVKIHPKMIYNRPPLNCQKCQFRFFTDQGLERHLLGSHGLVTSSVQEAANKGKDAGRCPVCGRVYQWKLLNHVARDHNLTLKPAHLSYKCTVCTATFGMYKQFENHVYSAHSVVAKRVMDKSKTSTTPAKGSDLRAKPLKINDEITIIPQHAKSTSSNTAKEK